MQQPVYYQQSPVTPTAPGQYYYDEAPAVYDKSSRNLIVPLSEATLSEDDTEEPTELHTIRIDNLKPGTEVEQVLKLIDYGPLEGWSMKETYALVTFGDSSVANACLHDLQNRIAELRTTLASDIEVQPAPTDHDAATRVIHIAGLPKDMTQSLIVKSLNEFGEIETIKFQNTKNSALVYFTTIESAIECMKALAAEHENATTLFSESTVSYARDVNSRSVSASGVNSVYELNNDSLLDPYSTPSTSVSSPQYGSAKLSSRLPSIPGPRHPAALHHQIVPPASYYAVAQSVTPILPPQSSSDYAPSFIQTPMSSLTHLPSFSSSPRYSPHPSTSSSVFETAYTNVGNRTIYLGNLDVTTTEEDICNMVRGGMLESVKLLRDKRVCFVTFIRPEDAAGFMSRATKSGVYVHSRLLKVGWGRNSSPLSPSIQEAVDDGASRNLYIGISKEEDDEAKASHSKRAVVPAEETLRRDFSFYGTVEQVNYFDDGRCAFVNFADIASCLKAISDFTGPRSSEIHAAFHDRYVPFTIAYGKDRCGLPPKKKKKKKKKKQASQKSQSRRNVSYEDEVASLDETFHQALDFMQIRSQMLDEKLHKNPFPKPLSSSDEESQSEADPQPPVMPVRRALSSSSSSCGTAIHRLHQPSVRASRRSTGVDPLVKFPSPYYNSPTIGYYGAPEVVDYPPQYPSPLPVAQPMPYQAPPAQPVYYQNYSSTQLVNQNRYYQAMPTAVPMVPVYYQTAPVAAVPAVPVPEEQWSDVDSSDDQEFDDAREDEEGLV